jgi:hypothetical protein
MGPQVSYYSPEILLELELHGPGIDARGAAFPGISLYVLLGRGKDFAWSATTATGDNVDEFVEKLCEPDGSKPTTQSTHYLYKGSCRAMERLDRTNSWMPTAGDRTPAGSETLTAYRTVHGIVHARGTVKGRKVAFVSARTTYFHEADSALGLFRYNDPKWMKDPQSFRRAADGINFAFNWAYIDSKHTAYQLSGWFPVRARGTSPDFPILGTGEFDWKGFDPARHTMATVPLRSRPHAVDQRYLISWNNKQAPGWAAADDQFAYGPLAREQMLTRFVRHFLRKRRKMSLAELVQAMEEPATQDLRAIKLLPVLVRLAGAPGLLRRLVGLRAQGPPQALPDGEGPRTVLADLLRPWIPTALPRHPPFHPQAGPGREPRTAVRLRCLHRGPAGELLRQEPLHDRERRERPTDAVPEPADVPADGRDRPLRTALSGDPARPGPPPGTRAGTPRTCGGDPPRRKGS